MSLTPYPCLPGVNSPAGTGNGLTDTNRTD